MPRRNKAVFFVVLNFFVSYFWVHIHMGISQEHQRMLKRLFDVTLSLAGLLLLSELILLFYLFSCLDTRSNGIFRQRRIGRHGKIFHLYKIKTMKRISGFDSTVTTAKDPRITRFGRWLRKTKVDELPQLWNVFVGDMSFVGPRPDVPGFANTLTGEKAIILSVRPGITGPATLKYRDEESLLADKSDPERYNREVIYPDKVMINMDYVQNWTFIYDLKIIFRTLCG